MIYHWFGGSEWQKNDKMWEAIKWKSPIPAKADVNILGDEWIVINETFVFTKEEYLKRKYENRKYDKTDATVTLTPSECLTQIDAMEQTTEGIERQIPKSNQLQYWHMNR